jgi:hypothetical protein
VKGPTDMTAVRREAPDCSACPDLFVIMLGMQVHTGYGLKTLLGLGKPFDAAGVTRPEGLLYYKNRTIFSLRPAPIGMRWYLRDMQSLQACSKSDPHRICRIPRYPGVDSLAPRVAPCRVSFMEAL